MKKIIKIDGMGCEHCIKSVKEVLTSINEIEVIEVKLGEATIEVKDEKILERIKEELDDAGYEVLE